MTSCTNEEPRYFGTKTCHVKANAFTIEAVGVYVPPRVPASHRQVPSEQACESTGGVRADRCAGCQGGVREDRCAGSPGGDPFDQALPTTVVPTAPTLMSPAPQFKINPALPGIATILSLPLRFSCRLPQLA